MRNRLSHVLFVMCLLVFALPCYAQYNSNVQGTVTDPTGAVVPAAKVTLHNVQTGVDTVTSTDGTGNYRFNQIPPNDYQVIVEATGFARKITAVTVTTNELAGVDVAVSPATATMKVEINAEIPTINPDETRLQSTLQQGEIQKLPLQNGSIFEVLRVAPGVVGIDEDRNLSIISIGGNSPNASANGKNGASNLYLMDGASIQSNTNNGGTLPTVQISPNADMVQEVTLETTTFAVDNGAGSSLRVNITTKSGTNDWHGDVGLRYTSNGMNAIPYTPGAINQAHVPELRKWWNGTIGGPIFKDRTFVFFSYLHQTQQLSTTSAIQYPTVDFANWAAGAFPNSVDVSKLMVPFAPDHASFQSVANTGKDWGYNSATNTCSFPIKPVYQFYLPSTSTVPIPCGLDVFDNGVFSQTPEVNGYQLNARVDQYFRGGKDRFYISYFKSPQMSDFLWYVSKYNSKTPSDSKYFNVNYTHTFSPTMLNQLGINYQRYDGSFYDAPSDVIPFLTLIIGIFDPFGAQGGGTPTYFGTPGPSYSLEKNYGLRDDLTWVKGRHNLKFGFGALRNTRLSNSGFNAKPSVPVFLNWSDFFLDSPAGYGLGAVINPATGAFQASITGASVYKYSLYAQDEWKIRPNLLLTFGLRWDDYGNPGPWGNGALPYAQVFPGTGANFQQQLSNSFVKKVGNAFSGSQNKNFLPRAGFAWSPGGNRKWSIRGGIGLFEDSLDLGAVTGSLSTQPPVALGLSYDHTLPAFLDAAGTVPNPLAHPSAVNLYGTTPGKAPFGFNYAPVTPLGFDARGGVIQYIDPVTGAVTLYPANLNGNDNGLRAQKTALYNISIERDLGYNIVAGVTYTGSRSWDLNFSGDYNTIPGDKITGTLLRPTNEWGSVNFLRNGYSSNYNALILLLRRTKGALTVQGSYTRSAANGDQTAGDVYSSVSGPLPFDATNRFSAAATYEVPTFVKEGFAKRLVEGWQVSGLALVQSGNPFTVITTAQYDNSCVAKSTCTPAANGDFLANGSNYGIPSLAYRVKGTGFSESQYLNGIVSPSAFVNPAGYGVTPGQGNQPFNMFRNPGYFSIDAAIHKKTTLPWFGERTSSLQLGVEATNLFNKVNLGGVTNDLSNSSFGKVTTAFQSRVIQLVARFQF